MVTGLQRLWNQAAGYANAYNNGKTLEHLKEQMGTFGISFTKTKSKNTWQTSVSPLLQVGVLLCFSDVVVAFAGGAELEVGQYFGGKAPHLDI